MERRLSRIEDEEQNTLLWFRLSFRFTHIKSKRHKRSCKSVLEHGVLDNHSFWRVSGISWSACQTVSACSRPNHK